MTNREEIERRRTFAIISHPDAGKTTLTEKLLLYGGAINQAGSVKGKQSAKHAVSDWMDIEKQRGISVTSSVLQFNYAGKCVNILDTPGHQDFSEDTYRTLMAADSAVMVIDAAKGVEAQTIKLFKVCTLRHIPIFTFINKMDREARDPFELMENIEEILGIKTYPMNWPIGCGKDFQGVYDRGSRKIIHFTSNGGAKAATATEVELGDPNLDGLIGERLHQQLTDEIELLDGAAAAFDLDRVRHGKLSPVFFGSALTNFGVERSVTRQRGPVAHRDATDGGGGPQRHFGVAVFASNVGVHVLDVDAGLLGDQEAQTCGVKVGTGAEALVCRQAGDLLGNMGCDINRVGDEHVDGVRSDLHEARNDGLENVDGGTDQFETGLTRLLTRTCGDDDHVGVTADLRIVGAIDGHGRIEAGAVLHVEDFGFDMLLGDVFEDDLTGDTALGGGEGERGTDCAGTDDGELCGLNG